VESSQCDSVARIQGFVLVDNFDYPPFKDWKLTDIGIYGGRYKPLSTEALGVTYVSYDSENILMGSISREVPNIKQWKGFDAP